MVKLTASLIALVASGAVLAHPHIVSEAELVKRQEFQTFSRRSLGDCASKLRARGGVAERAMSRRVEFANKARKARGLDLGRPFIRKRDLATILATDHESNRTDLTADSDSSDVFDGNSTCVLAPEGEVGPYLVNGELIRSDIVEDQEGVELYMDLQFIDISTCEPLSDVYIETWSANATGVYSGIVASGNGVGTSDPSNINTTFLRGIQETSDEGYVQFHTIVPGHYSGRAHHIHIVARQTNGILNANGTYTDATASHIGQLFFDQSLLTDINDLSPYTENTDTLTTNAEDRVLADEADVDPVLEYVLLGDSLSDGILGWTSIGINTTASYEASAAGTLTEDGGVASDDSGVTGGDGDGTSGAPSGSATSGSAPVPSSSA